MTNQLHNNNNNKETPQRPFAFLTFVNLITYFSLEFLLLFFSIFLNNGGH